MPTVAVVGLGYVGLPLDVEFGKIYPTIGVDLHVEKIEAYRRFVDLPAFSEPGGGFGVGAPAEDELRPRSSTGARWCCVAQPVTKDNTVAETAKRNKEFMYMSVTSSDA